MKRISLALAGMLFAAATTQAQTDAPPADKPATTQTDAPAPAAAEPPVTPTVDATQMPIAPPPQGAGPAADDQAAFNTFRRDVINLVVLKADGRQLAAAAQLAAPDQNDGARMAQKRPPGLLKRAQQFGGQDPYVLYVAAANVCLSEPGCADPAARKALEGIDADNAAVWLMGFPIEGNAQKAQAVVARMAQAQRYDDYWGANVVALYHALEVLPVPASVLRQGVGTEAARINFATSIASTLLPPQLKPLGGFCRAAAGKDEALVGDCIAVARKLEVGGTFISQKVGFAIEDALVPAGVNHDVMLARQRSAAWQQEQFLQLSGRFTREPALAQAYLRLLGSEQNELAAVLALLREQQIHTDPPAGWGPQSPAGNDPLLAPGTRNNNG